jgi:arginine repressor
VLKDEVDVDPNDQASVLEHLDKIVRNLIKKSSQPTASRPETKLPLIRIKVKKTEEMYSAQINQDRNNESAHIVL